MSFLSITPNTAKALKEIFNEKKSPNGLTISSSSNRMEELSQPTDWFSGYNSLLLSLPKHTHTHVERPFVRDYPGEPVPER